MRRLFWVLILAAFTGCSSMGGNITPSSVTLTIKNYKVLNRVTSKASAVYVFNAFGPSRQDLIGRAVTELYSKAGLQGHSRALVDVSIDKQINFYLLAYQLSVFASGTVVEFYTSEEMKNNSSSDSR